ncbi:cyclic lactone autoinducer peptide [Cohnella herbarum]|uniref:Cyclic lactone autoinducer peptide n=1 Tax=Cohnella herbarum TaxID=2728023 RepID=A0A7Z2ZPH5_9BACL|nr:cyclic lactone autoinducer peptide [Cohnella herbarum]QJD87169.1 cyclic lactone autoinducer peptide [Cohnella herbarum]
MNRRLFTFLATALGMAATLFVTTACMGAVGHRPEVPAELLKQ